MVRCSSMGLYGTNENEEEDVDQTVVNCRFVAEEDKEKLWICGRRMNEEGKRDMGKGMSLEVGLQKDREKRRSEG